MSETTTAAVESAETETVEIAPELLAKINPLAAFFQNLKEITDSANEQAVKIRTATSGKEDALATVLNTSDDEAVVKFRENWKKGEDAKAKIEAQMAELKEAITKHAETLLPSATAGFKVEEERADFMAKRKDATTLGNAILVMLGGDEAAKKAAYDHFGITEVVSLGRGGSVTGAGSKKPRISAATIDGQPFADAKGNVTFTSLSNHIGAEVNDLRTAYFKAAGTEDTNAIKGKEISFPFSVKGKTVNLVLTASEGNVAKKVDDETAPVETVESE